MTTSPSAALCDFCNATAVRWEYPCADFRAVLLAFHPDGQMLAEERGYTGGWAACENCAQKIEAGDRDGLLAQFAGRHLGTFRGDDGERVTALLDVTRALHAGFFDHRTGPRRPYDAPGAS